MKKLIAVMLAALLMLSACGEAQEIPSAEVEIPQIKDVCTNGVKWGNTLAAEQGDWVALRGEHEGKIGLMLYNKNDESASFLLEGDVCGIGLLENAIYYQLMGESGLYRYDITAQKSSKLLNDCSAYQVRKNEIYYLTAAHVGRLECLDLALGLPHAIETDHAVNAFWLTDRGIYYRNDAIGMLRFMAYDSEIEQMVYQNKSAAAEDVIAVADEKIAFLVKGKGELSTLYSYDHAEKKLHKHLNLAFAHLNYANGYVVTVENGSHIYAVDINTDKVYDWGAVEEHHYPQILSDSVILYQGNRPVFQYYPEK